MCSEGGEVGGGRERGGRGKNLWRRVGGEEKGEREKGERERVGGGTEWGEREKGGRERKRESSLLFFSPPGVTLTLLTLTTRLRPGGCLRECFRHFKM